jgi:hypothetical protein
MPVQGVVESLEKGTERGLVTWRFMVRLAEGSAVVVELRGEEVHGVLRDGDEVRLDDEASRRADVLTPRLVENKTVGVDITVHREPPVRRMGAYLGKTVATTVVSSLAAAAVTVALTSSSGDEAPAPAAPGEPLPIAPSDEPLGVGDIAVLSILEFVVIWLIWFIIWGRRWTKPARRWATGGIAASACLAFALGIAAT